MIIYTGIFDGYDRLPEPLETNSNIEYICFSNNMKRSNKSKWKIREINPPYDSTRKNRYVKINSHLFFQENEILIYIDPTFLITHDFFNNIEKWLNGRDIACRSHPSRNCIYDEAEYLIKDKKHKLDSIKTVYKQMMRYEKDGFPRNYGLCEGGFLIRRNTKQIQKLNELWWDIVKNYSKRDQLSFMYSIWKTNIDINIIPREEIDSYTVRCKYHK